MRFQTTITKKSSVRNEARLKQTDGIFYLAPGPDSILTWSIDLELPDTWSVGAIIGPSGSGKTVIARELAKQLGSRLIEAKDEKGNLKEPFEWDRNRAVCAHTDLPIREWTGLLSRVGFSSPPAWRRPYQVLSNGQQFRCNLARAIAEAGDVPVFFDEFASLVHDQVATIASTAVAKSMRAMGRQLVAVTWREDILPALEPDWVVFCGADQSVRLVVNAEGEHGRPFGGNRSVCGPSACIRPRGLYSKVIII